MKITIVLLSMLMCACTSTTQTASVSHFTKSGPVNFITTDVDNFWKAYTLCKGNTIPMQEKIFDSLYIKKASPCLAEILAANRSSAPGFVKYINSEEKYFAVCKSVTDSISDYEEDINRYMQKLKTLYPKTKYCDIYFMFTQFYTGGQSRKAGIAIGMDYWSLPDTPQVNFTNPLFTELVRKINMMPVTVVHELIHRNQLLKKPAGLLGKCIIEGAADFIAYLVTEKINNPKIHAFGNANEKDLWLRFKNDIPANNLNYWLYNNYDSSRPRDLGYWMGFKICENYYAIATDKNKAIYDIMQVTDPYAFLTLSRYALKFD